MYLGLLATSVFFIFINNIVMKYNSETWCKNADNYSLAYTAAQASASPGLYTGYMHIFFTIINLVNYGFALACASGLFAMYERKKGTLVNRKLKQN